jgi:hypothetical protein
VMDYLMSGSCVMVIETDDFKKICSRLLEVLYEFLDKCCIEPRTYYVYVMIRTQRYDDAKPVREEA